MSSGSRSRAELAGALRATLLSDADAASLDVHGDTDAAVLMPLYLDGPDLHVVFTRRHPDMRLHAGQVSFPGGRRDEGERLRDAALREACEEIGLAPDGVEVVGALRPTPTFVTGYRIYPFAGIIEPGQTWRPSDAEVAAVIEPTVTQLRDGAADRPVETPRGTLTMETYLVGDDLIWGATARIVGDLLKALAV